jgi:hypothetical protein
MSIYESQIPEGQNTQHSKNLRVKYPRSLVNESLEIILAIFQKPMAPVLPNHCNMYLATSVYLANRNGLATSLAGIKNHDQYKHTTAVITRYVSRT